MSTEQDLQLIQEQEQRLHFSAFDEDTAFSIGCALRARAMAASLPIVIDIVLNERRLFFAALPGSTVSLADWTRRKMNAVRVFHKSTYRLVLERHRPERLFEPMHNLPQSDYVIAGGAFPIILHGTGVVGAIGLAGAHEREDHGIVVEAMCRHIGIDPVPLMLPPLR